MVHDDVVGPTHRPHCIRLPTGALRHAGRTRADADVLDHDIVCSDVEAGADQGDAGRGRRLSGDGDEGLRQLQLLAAKVDDAADFKHDDPRAGSVERLQEGAGA